VGNRDANRAVWVMVMCRMAKDARTRAYVDKRTRQGLSKREIVRCLKRYVARQIYRTLVPTLLSLVVMPDAKPASATLDKP
jgi:transposase